MAYDVRMGIKVKELDRPDLRLDVVLAKRPIKEQVADLGRPNDSDNRRVGRRSDLDAGGLPQYAVGAVTAREHLLHLQRELDAVEWVSMPGMHW